MTSWGSHATHLHTEDPHVWWQVLVDGACIADALWVFMVCGVVHQDAQPNDSAQGVHALVCPASKR
jgi:hypothetical protein